MTEDPRATSPTVLRVAKIISELYDPGHVGPVCIKVAREILEAIREPTAEMITAGENNMFYDSEKAIPDIFRAMIDETLK